MEVGKGKFGGLLFAMDLPRSFCSVGCGAGLVRGAGDADRDLADPFC